MRRDGIQNGFSEGEAATRFRLGEPLSPELALVDPELAERARRVLPPPGVRHIAAAPALEKDKEAARITLEEQTQPKPLEALRAVAVTGLVVGLGIVGLLVGLELAHEQPSLERGAAQPAPAASSRSPAAEAPLIMTRGRTRTARAPAPPPPAASGTRPQPRKRPQTPAILRERLTLARDEPISIRWKPVRRATFYWVQVYRVGLPGARKVLEATPSGPRLTLSSVRRLRPGRYRWEVWPQFSSRRKLEYGRLVQKGAFVVRRS